jgi:hypothetical protein
MELDAVNLGPLSQQDRDYLRQNGGCFRCRRLGHFGNQCPSFPGNELRQ